MYYKPTWPGIDDMLYPYIIQFPYDSSFGDGDLVVATSDTLLLDPEGPEDKRWKDLPTTVVRGNLRVPDLSGGIYRTAVRLEGDIHASMKSVVRRDRMSIYCFQEVIRMRSYPVNPRNTDQIRNLQRFSEEAKRLGVHEKDYPNFYLHRNNTRSYFCKIMSGTSRVEINTFYHVGPGIHRLPSVGGVLESLLADREYLGEASDMWDWFEAIGEGTPTRQSENSYRECVSNTEQLESLLYYFPALEVVYKAAMYD